MLVQLTQETRDDVKHIRAHDLPELRERMSKLEAQSNSSAGPRSWPTLKTGAGVAAIVPLFYALIQLAQSVGWLPPTAPGVAPPPVITAAP